MKIKTKATIEQQEQWVKNITKKLTYSDEGMYAYRRAILDLLEKEQINLMLSDGIIEIEN